MQVTYFFLLLPAQNIQYCKILKHKYKKYIHKLLNIYDLQNKTQATLKNCF